ncbi:MAG: recombinase family protein, partial [Magnetococcus sp. YQC-3]
MKTRKEVTPQNRCAIYTRKSHEEGLDMAFNSLDAQYEACASYIASQKAEGWLALPDRYDDGGFSGGNIERPALRRLMADIEANRIDCVVVYKIDRLTRSLMDFSKLVEVFERHNVTFVSVTQHFSTTSSMGRLTLNILLSFSQFERELSAERIRDKVFASRKRGIWMGGYAPIGYDVRDRKLVINDTEADLVRHIFKRFAQLGSATTLVKELADAGYHTKAWTAKTGRVHEGKPFDKGAIYRILNNRVYLGEATHKGNSYPGEHTAIIEQADWDLAQSILAAHTRERSNRARAETPAALKGILCCGACGRAMKPSHTIKEGRMYRYYTCQNALKNGADACPVKNIGAGDIEEIVLQHMHLLIKSPEMVARIWRESKTAGGKLTANETTQALKSLEPVWGELFPG